MTATHLRSYQGKYPEISSSTYIDASSIVIGDVQMEAESSIWPLVVARADVNFIRIGARTNIQDGSVLHVSRPTASQPAGYPLLIGDDVTVGHKVMLHGCQLKNRILVGMGAIVMDGAVIEDDVIIGAGSLVPPNKTLQSGYLYVGSPVKQQRPLTEKECKFLKKSADNYVELKNNYLTDSK